MSDIDRKINPGDPSIDIFITKYNNNKTSVAYFQVENQIVVLELQYFKNKTFKAIKKCLLL